MAAGMPHVVFFGAARAGEYETLLGRGFSVGLIRDAGNPDAAHIPPGLHRLDEVPFPGDCRTAMDQLVPIARAQAPAAMMTPLDEHLHLGHAVAEQLGIAALPSSTVALARDKSRMRDRLVAALGWRHVGAYAPVSSPADALAFARRVGFPVVLKPASLYSSLFVTLCETEEELVAAVTTLQERVPAQHGAREARCLLQIEEYLPGSNHSVDCVASRDDVVATPVVDVVTGRDVGGQGFYHFSRRAPSQLSQADQQELQCLAVEATKALDISPGVGHVEMILTPSGPRVVEVAARPGGNRSRLLALAFGIDLPGAYADALLGDPVRVVALPRAHAAVVSLCPSRPGRLRGYHNLGALRELPAVRQVTVKAACGDYVAEPQAGGHAAVMVELADQHGDRVERVLAQLAESADSFFELAPETEAHR